ncbi:hypothetical protein C1878_13890 [Gordonibacter sp. 28C]|uniref:glycosyltransferase family 2 protein n=1 Tax=Gordonibacter sp. 28C TaxID=2078569 RepID=UPI000DF7589A|nr:glycosyltransferase family A protein [Gordonibacter sp. 28C]RDB60539.1 hypothetical protein C1878_13890 [Gordonibacter sp. 28C]
MRSPLLSIVIPAYNAQNYLSDCLNSILMQDFEDYQVVIVDDGSIDDTPKICGAFESSHSGKIIYFRQENKGPLLARLRGLDEASGRYVTFVDSDDMLHHFSLLQVADALGRLMPDMLMFDMSQHKSFDKSGPRLFDVDYELSVIEKEQVVTKLYSTHLLNSPFCKVFKKDTVNDATSSLSRFAYYSSSEDYLMVMTLIDACTTFAYLRSPLYYYRNTPGSLSRSFALEKAEQSLAVRNIALNNASKWAAKFGSEDIYRGACVDACATFSGIIESAALNCKDTSEVFNLVRKSDCFNRSVIEGPRDMVVRIDRLVECELLKQSHFLLLKMLSKIFFVAKQIKKNLFGA